MSNLKNFLFTSESVSEGHPDKVSHATLENGSPDR